VAFPAELRPLLAQPREAGSAGAAQARDLLARRLRKLGYKVEVQPVPFAPTSLNAFPLFGAGLGWMALSLLPLLALSGVPSWGALAAWVAELGAMLTLAGGVAMGASDRNAELRQDANLIARRPGGKVRRWIVAHTDTKAQRHSMAGRLVAVWWVVAGTLFLGALAAFRLRGAIPLGLAGAGALVALVGGFLAGQGRLRGSSMGARDNGSGVVAALAAAEANTDPATGILLTGAEEFGMVGAREFARREGDTLKGVEVINLDTLDDRGSVSVVSHDIRGRALGQALVPALAPLGWPVRLRRLPLGIFVDSYPLARAGATAVTIGRLDWSTLRKIHTERDTDDGLDFETAERVGRALASIT
jgi:hypothetical protein